MIIHENNTWYSPLRPFNTVEVLQNKYGMAVEVIDKRFKKLKEARVLGVGALVLASLQETFNPTYIQLNPNDPPDGFILRQLPEKRGHIGILNVEITGFNGETPETLYEQLVRTKKLLEQPLLDEKDIILVDLRTDSKVDFDCIYDFLKRTKSQFPIIAVKPAKNEKGDTIARTTVVYPGKGSVFSKDINIGHMAFQYSQNKISPAVFTKRTGSIKNVRQEETNEKPPKPIWELEIERILGQIL